MKRKALAILPFALILIFILVFYFNEGLHFFSFETIQKENLKWRAFVHENPILSAVSFMGIYTVSVLFVLPDSTFLTLLGGFLFPMPLAIAYACISETIGGTLFFLAIKLAYTETLGEKKPRLLREMQLKIRDDEASYLLFLRLSHLLPFWLVNTGAAIFRVKPFTFIWTTLIGTLPLIFFLVDAGESLSKYSETHTQFHLEDLFTTQLKIILAGLGCLALLPLLYKKFRKKKQP